MVPDNPAQEVGKQSEGGIEDENGDSQVISPVEQTAAPSESAIIIDTSFVTPRPASIQRFPVELFVTIFSFMQPALPGAASWACAASQNEAEARLAWMVVTQVCSRWRAIARGAQCLWNTIDTRKGKVFGAWVDMDEDWKFVFKFPGSSNPLVVFLQPGGPYDTFFTVILPRIPSTQPVFIDSADVATTLQLQCLTRKYNVCVKAIRCSNPIGRRPVSVLKGAFPTVEGLGLSNQLTRRDVHFESLRALLIEHMQIDTPHKMERLAKMLQAMPVLDDLKFKDVIVIHRLENTANQHRLARTNIKRMRFERSSGVEILLTCIGLPAGVEIVLQDTPPTGILPRMYNNLRGEFESYDTGLVTIGNGNVRIDISAGSSKLTAEWTEEGYWDIGCSMLLWNVTDVTIRADDFVVFTRIYTKLQDVKTLHLEFSSRDCLLAALRPLGTLIDEMEELEELHCFADWAWVDVLQVMGSILEEREKQEMSTIHYVIHSGRLGGNTMPEEAPEGWARAKAELDQCAERIKVAHEKRVAEEGDVEEDADDSGSE